MLDRVRTADFGFETKGLVAARVDPAAASKGGRADFSLRSVRDTLAQAGGVLSVTMGDGMPVDFDSRYVRVSQSNGTEFVSAHVTRVAEKYLDTLGARLLRGRSITAEDRAAAARVVVISEPLATRLFPNGDAIGERLTFSLEKEREEEFTIIGVTADFATSQLTTERPQMLLPLPEKPASAVYLIARGAAADETRLTSAFQNVGRDSAWNSFPAGLGCFKAIVTGTQLEQKSLQDLVAESIGCRGCRRHRAGAGVPGRAWRHRVHGRDAHPRDRRANGAGRHTATGSGVDAVRRRETRHAWRGRRTPRWRCPDSHHGQRHGDSADGRLDSTRRRGASDLRGRRLGCGRCRAPGRPAGGPPRSIDPANDCDAVGIEVYASGDCTLPRLRPPHADAATQAGAARLLVLQQRRNRLALASRATKINDGGAAQISEPVPFDDRPELIQRPEQQSVEARAKIVEAEVDEDAAVAFSTLPTTGPWRSLVRDQRVRLRTSRRRRADLRARRWGPRSRTAVPPHRRPPEMRRQLLWIAYFAATS